MDVSVLVLLATLLAVVLGGLLLLRGRQSPKPKSGGRQAAAPAAVAAVGPRGRRVGPRMSRRPAPSAASPSAVDDEDEEDVNYDDAEIDHDDDVDDDVAKVGGGGKVGKKKLEKLALKAEKKKAREAELAEREELKKKREKQEAEEQRLRLKEEEEEKLRVEKEKREQEERERREHEEYLKMKAAFDVEEEGFDQKELDEAEERNELQSFLSYIRRMKVVALEELAAHFGLKTQAATERVHSLMESHDLNGVMDEDRGKFICILDEEMEAVAKFIRQRGRVSIAELAQHSNELINLQPDIANVVQPLEQQVQS